jgi:hypothetical protein
MKIKEIQTFYTIENNLVVMIIYENENKELYYHIYVIENLIENKIGNK